MLKLQVQPLSHDERYSWGIRNALGSAAMDIFNVLGDIPQHIAGIDKEADPFLGRLIENLEALGKKWKEDTSPDSLLLELVLKDIDLLTQEKSPEMILYPQIMGAEKKTSVEKEEEYILQAKRKAKENATKVQEQAKKLFKLLSPFASLSTHEKKTKPALEAIGKFKALLEELAHEQRSPVAKVIHLVTKVAKERWEMIRKGALPTDQLHLQHPLSRLQLAIGNYLSQEIHLEDNRMKEISGALRDLDTLSPFFYGIHRYVTSRLKQPHKDLKALHHCISRFIYRRLSLKLEDIVKYEDLLVTVAENANKEGVNGAPDQYAEEKIKKEWAKKFLSKDLSSYQDKGKFAELLDNAAVTHLAYRDFERQAIGLQQEALKLKLEEIPEEKADLSEIVTWAFKLSNTQEKYNKSHPSFHQLLTVALATERTNAICTLAHTVDKQKEIESATQSKKPLQYGQSLFPKEVGEWPKTEKEVSAADTIWEALAIYEQVEECSRLSAGMSSKSTQTKSTYAILESLDQAIDYLERIPCLNKKKQEEAMMVIKKHILEWMNFAKIQMQHQTHSTWRHSEIERNFEEAIKRLRKGNFIGALKYIRNIILEGELGTILGREVDTPLTGLQVPFNSFNEAVLPEKPSKVKKEVYTRLGIDSNTKWKGEYLDEAIAREQVSLVNNVLMLACHQFVALFIKPKSPQQEFSTLVSAMDTLSGVDNHYELNGLEEELKKLALSGYNFQSEEGRQLISRVRENIKTTKELYSDLKSEAAQKALHESLYFSLLSVVIETHTTPWSLERLSANGLFVVFYKLVELFVRPFTETLIRSFRENVALQSQGTLNETHLRPVAGLTKAFSTYNQTLLHWKERLDDQQKPNAPPKKKGLYLTGEKGGDVVILLDDKQRYDGMTPRQIGRAAGYHAVTKYLRVANICTRMNGLLQNIQHNVARDEYENVVINQAYKVIKHILSIIPYTLTYSAYFSLKLLEMSFNFLAQQVAMFAIWKWDLINVLIEQSLTSIFESKERAPIFDSLVLDALKDFKRDLDRGVPQQEAKAGGMDETNVRKIGELLQHLFETIELDKYDSTQQLEDRARNGIFSDGKKLVYEQLKKLLSVVIITTSKTFLKKEGMENILFKVLQILNDGLRSGKVAKLSEEQMKELRDQLNKEPDEEEIANRAKEIEDQAIHEIPKVLEAIRQSTVNPAIDRAIDGSFESRSQILLKYVGWLENRLYSYGEEEEMNGNIVRNLRDKLNFCEIDYEGLKSKEEKKKIAGDYYDKSIEHVSESDLKSLNNSLVKEFALRELHAYYAIFIYEMTQFQSKMDRSPSPNAPELSQLIKTHLVAPLSELTQEIKKYVEKGNNKDTCFQAIEALDKKIHESARLLNKVKLAEESRMMGMHSGLEGFVRGRIEGLIETLKGASKQTVHDIAAWQTDDKVEKARRLYKNPALARHVVNWQLRVFLDPSLGK